MNVNAFNSGSSNQHDRSNQRYASQGNVRNAQNGEFLGQAVENHAQLMLQSQHNSAGGIKKGGNQSDIYKLYLNYMPNGQQSEGGPRMTPGKRPMSGNKTQQNIVMKNRQNVLKQTNQVVKSNQKVQQSSEKVVGGQNLPLIQQSLTGQQVSDIQTNYVN